MKFKIGDKVIPVSKYGKDLKYSAVWESCKKGYMYINHIKENGIIVCFNEKVNYLNGDHFKKEDLIFYKPKKKIIKELKKENKQLKLEIAKLRQSSNLVKEELVKINNELRAKIIEKAKLFVKENITPNTIIEDWNKIGAIKGFKGFHESTCLIPYFLVDKKNRMMRLILKGVESNIVKANLSLKCSDNDVFNEDIGKAILIGRAKGLNVSEFENCVQPDFYKGQLIKCCGDEILEIDFIVSNSISKKVIHFTKGTWMLDSECKILDDTNTIYEVN